MIEEEFPHIPIEEVEPQQEPTPRGEELNPHVTVSLQEQHQNQEPMQSEVPQTNPVANGSPLEFVTKLQIKNLTITLWITLCVMFLLLFLPWTSGSFEHKSIGAWAFNSWNGVFVLVAILTTAVFSLLYKLNSELDFTHWCWIPVLAIVLFTFIGLVAPQGSITFEAGGMMVSASVSAIESRGGEIGPDVGVVLCFFISLFSTATCIAIFIKSRVDYALHTI